MRILQVRFKNLNSLVGEWEIDLTHPAFVADGIFAITGPTGAGKTTILDAICLALYGRTPRLSNISKSANEIMSRQTTECFAEVTFETQQSKYCCCWSQRRAGKKIDGNLQQPKHEISDAVSGAIFENKLRDVAQKVEKVAGMDFERFTRSILLAQGDFAAFLQAAPDERSPILEQITGTEIYSHISIKVHERQKEELAKLKNLQAELEGMQLLSADAILQLNIDLKKLQHDESVLKTELLLKNQAVTWLESLARLDVELAEISAQTKCWEQDRETFQPKLVELQRAEKTLAFTGEYADLKAVRREQETETTNHSTLQMQIPKCEAEVKKTQEAFDGLEATLNLKRNEQKETATLLVKVRAIDVQLAEKEKPISETLGLLAKKTELLVELKKPYADNVVDLEKMRETFENVCALLEKHKEDETLNEQLAGIVNQFEMLKKQVSHRNKKDKEFGVAESEKTKTNVLWEESSQELKSLEIEVLDVQNQFEQKQDALKNVLAERELPRWRDDWVNGNEKKILLEKLLASIDDFEKTRGQNDELTQRRIMLNTRQNELVTAINEQIEIITCLETECQQLENERELLKKVHDLDEHRKTLHDGEPCPLCGAKEHPYATGNVPQLNETTTALKRQKSELKKANAALSDVKIEQATNQTNAQNVAQQLAQCAVRLTELESTILDLEKNAGLSAGHSFAQNSRETLVVLLAETCQKLEKVSGVVLTVEQYEKEMTAIRESLAALQKSRDLVNDRTKDAAHKKEMVVQTVKRLEFELAQLFDEFQRLQNELLLNIDNYGIKKIEIDAIDKIVVDLETRRRQWLAWQKEKSEIERNVVTLNLTVLHQFDQVARLENEQQQSRKELDVLQREHETLKQERQLLFGDKQPENEETRITSEIATAENSLESTRKANQESLQRLAGIKNNIEIIEQSLTKRNELLKAKTAAFCERIAASGFADETDFESACLSDELRQQRAGQYQKLKTIETELKTRYADKTLQRDAERAKNLTMQPRDELEKESVELQNRCNEIQQKIGAATQQLKSDETLKSKKQERVDEKKLQNAECERWNALHHLIGSSDGKKFRNFAQGLTFEMMIRYANHQLQKMTDRYLLIRHHELPLELNIIDHHQAGEIRSTKNLSGGESFIVSLALALGLSQMSSKNVRVDSLFLDEGFGTLDDETLEKALETLARLRQNGKWVGVISHVPALKERIGTQIQVVPQSGGRSVLFGPGCRQGTALQENKENARSI